MTKTQDAYGKLVSIAEATLSDEPEIEGYTEERDTAATGTPLAEYRLTGRINGIPVAEGDTKLNINSDNVLYSAFTLTTEPKLIFTAIKPDDKKSRKEYDDLLDKLKDSRVRIVEEIKQYDANTGKFIVWVRYDELQWKLHPRFEFLRNE